MELSTAERLSTVRDPLPQADFLGQKRADRQCSQSAACTRLACPRKGLSADGSGGSGVKLRLLLVEDNPEDVELELAALRKEGFDVSSDVAQTAEEFTSRILTTKYDLILADYNLPQWKGTEALDILRRENVDVPLIVVTGYLGEE